MKARMSQLQPRQSLQPGNEEVPRDIRSFLQALDSYLDHFAKEPGITFEQHLCSLASAGAGEPRQRSWRTPNDSPAE
jgi:hypothetical protein